MARLQTLTPLQEAQLETASYPWCPDIWQLVTAVAATAPAPPAKDALGGDGAAEAGRGVSNKRGGKRGAAAASLPAEAGQEGGLDAALLVRAWTAWGRPVSLRVLCARFSWHDRTNATLLYQL